MHTGTLNLRALLVCEHKDNTNTDIYTAFVVRESRLQEEFVNVATTFAVAIRLWMPGCTCGGDQGSATALGQLMWFRLGRRTGNLHLLLLAEKRT